MVLCKTEQCALRFLLTAGQRGDAPPGRSLLRALGRAPSRRCALLMDSAYEGNETRALVRSPGYRPVAPPNPLRLRRWRLDRKTYRRRHEVERLFRRLKVYRRVFTRFDQLDTMFTAFIHHILIFDALR